MKRFSVNFTTVYANSTTPRVFPVSGWMGGSDLAKMRATVEIREIIGDIEVELAIQVADVENAPGAVTSISGYKTTVDVHYPTAWTSVGSALEGKQMFRYVLRAKNTSTSNMSFAYVGAVVEIVLAA